MRLHHAPMLVLFLFGSCASPDAEQWRPAPIETRSSTGAESPAWDAESYELHLEPRDGGWRGISRLRLAGLRAADELRLDRFSTEVTSVRDGMGRPLDYRVDADQLVIDVTSPAEGEGCVTVEVGFRIAESDAQSRLIEGAGWFPSLAADSDRATFDLHLSLPIDWRWNVGGRLISERSELGRRRLHIRRAQPQLPRSIVVVAGPGGPGPERSEDWQAEQDQVLTFLEDWTRSAAPWWAAQVSFETNLTQASGGGGQLVLPSGSTVDERHRRDELGAPLVHHWARRWLLDLLQPPMQGGVLGPWWFEGLARQAELDWLRQQGMDERADELRLSWLTSLDSAGHEALSSASAWEADRGARAALVLELLREELDAGTYAAGLGTFLGTARGTEANGQTLQDAWEAAAGRDLDQFFALWVHSRGGARLETSWTYDAERGRVLLRVNQVHSLEDGEPEAYSFPANVHVEGSEGAVSHEVAISERRNLIEFAQRDKPLWLRFDVGRRVPALVRERRSAEAWFQVSEASIDSYGRHASVEALLALAANSDEGQRIAGHLARRLEQETHALVRARLATGLGQLAVQQGLRQDAALRKAALEDPSARVRVAALKALGSSAAGNAESLWPVVRDSVKDAYSWMVLSAAFELGSRIDAPATVGLLAEGLPQGLRGEEGAIGLQVLIWTRAPRALEACLEAARDLRAGILARTAAIQGLGSLLERDAARPAREGLADLLGDSQPAIAYAAAASLARAARGGDQRAGQILERSYSDFTDPRMRQVILTAWAQ